MSFSGKVQAKRHRRRWRRFVALFFILVGASCCGGEVGAGVHAPLRIFKGDGRLGGDALLALIRASGTNTTRCSVAVMADHSATAATVMQGSSGNYADGGTMLLQLPASVNADNEPINSTTNTNHINEVIKVIRKLRQTTECLTVVFASDSVPLLHIMLEQATEGRLMLWTTHVIVVTSASQESALSNLEGVWAFTMMNTHLLLLRPSTSPPSALVFRHEPYSPEGSRTVLVGYYSAQRGLGLTAPVHYEKFENFYGAAITYTTLTYMPYTLVTEVIAADGSKSYTVSGTDYDIMMTFGKILNFTTRYVETENWGTIQDAVANREVFIIPNMFYVTPIRSERYSYVAPHITGDVVFVMRKPNILSSWDSFMRPFYLDVWLFTLGIVITLAMCLVIVLKCSWADNIISVKLRGGAQLFGPVTELTKTRALFEVFGALLGQDFTFKMPNTNSFRILLTAWFLFIIVLSTAYKSNFIAAMTSPKKPTKPETLKQLVDSGALITAPPYGKAHQKIFQDSHSKDHQTLATRYTIVPNTIAGLKSAMDEGTAHIEGREFLSFYVAENFMKDDGTNDLYLGREGILNLVQSLLIPHESPYQLQFDKIMLDIVQGGLYTNWHDQEVEKLRIAKVEAAAKKKEAGEATDLATDTSVVKPLTLDNMQGPFWMLLGGAALASICFGVEVLRRKCAGTSRN